MIESKKLLKNSYVVTVSTTPSNATCTLTYEGVNYTQKSLTVTEGSTISYSVSYSGYVTQTGSWTITEDVIKYITLSPVQYTLTVSTNPSAATCTLTYNGSSYTAKSATVNSGTTISYSIYHSTYGTKTGTITMNSNKTITATGTYTSTPTTTYSDTSWTRPNLTSNGTLGGSSFAVNASGYYSSYYVWKAVDSDNSSMWDIQTSGAWYTFYNPTALKVSSITMTQFSGSDYKHWSIKGTVYASNNNSSWSSVGSYNSDAKNITISISTGGSYYKYYKISSTACHSGNRWGINNLGISAVYQTSSTTYSYSYYWNITTS